VPGLRCVTPFRAFGVYVTLTSLKERVKILITTGLPSVTIKYLFQSELNLDVSQNKIDSAVNSLPHCRNHYGLIQYNDTPNLIVALDSRGLDFAMLRELVKDMSLQISDEHVLYMFNRMDINGDYALSLSEILIGFEALYYLFLPN